MWLARCGSLVECNPAGAHIVHRTRQSDLTLVDHLSQQNAPVAELLHGELHVHFRDGLDKLIVLRSSGRVVSPHRIYGRIDVGECRRQQPELGLVTGALDGAALGMTHDHD